MFMLENIYIGEEFLPILKKNIFNNIIKEKVGTGLSLGADEQYQIPNFPENKKIIYATLFLETSGNASVGADNFIIPGTGYNYLTNSSDFTGNFKGIYAQISADGLIRTSTYRHGGVNVIGYRIKYLDY